VPVTSREESPPFEVKLTFAEKTPTVVGVKRTTTTWLAPAPRLKEPPATMLKGADVDAAPVKVPSPVFVTVNERSADCPTTTEPKSTVVAGMTEATGTGVGVALTGRGP